MPPALASCRSLTPRPAHPFPRVSIALAAVAVALLPLLAGSSSSYADIGGQIKDAQAQLDALNARSEATAEQFNASRIELAKADRAVSAAQARVEASTATMRTQQAAVAQFAAAAAYRNGNMQEVSVITAKGGVQDFLDKVGALDSVARGQKQALAGLAVAKHQQAAAQADARRALSGQQAVTARLAAAKASLEADAGHMQQLLGQLQAQQAEQIRQAELAAARAAAAREADAEAAAQRAASAARTRQAELAAQAASIAAAARSFTAPAVSAAAAPAPAAGTVAAAASRPSTPAPPPGAGAGTAVAWAYRELGMPYVWGAAGPDSFDCSGLTQYVWAKAGVSLDHYTGAQFNQGRRVSVGEIQPGDLIFYGSDLHHEGIYVGGGNMIHAPHTGDVVKVSSIFSDGAIAGVVRVTG